MKLVRMQYSPDAFENFLKNKLDEVKPDPSLQDQLWADFEKMEVQKKRGGGKKWFFGFAILMVGLVTYLAWPGTNVIEQSQNNKAATRTPADTQSPAADIAVSNPVDTTSNTITIDEQPAVTNEHETINRKPLAAQPQADENEEPNSIISPEKSTIVVPERTIAQPEASARVVTVPANTTIPADTLANKSNPANKKKKTPVHIIW